MNQKIMDDVDNDGNSALILSIMFEKLFSCKILI